MAGDVLSTVDDSHAGEPLLRPVMRAGKRLAPAPSLDEVRAHAAAQLAALPEGLRRLDPAASYPVEVGARLKALAAETDRWINHSGES
jgi:nicotinate phosphoribosyltransferase